MVGEEVHKFHPVVVGLARRTPVPSRNPCEGRHPRDETLYGPFRDGRTGEWTRREECSYWRSDAA